MIDLTFNVFIIIILSFFIGLISAIIISRFGIKWGFVDIPNIRSSHTKAISRGGGIGIPIAITLIVILFIKSLYILILLSLILSIFCLIDDKKGLPVWIRLVIEIVFASVIIFSYKKNFIYFIHDKFGLLAVFLIAVFFIVYITASTNFFNFMDGINGIAGLEAIISFGLVGFYSSFFKDSYEISFISFAVVSASLGFLLLNFPKPKVFMGDVGSIFIGFLFSGTVLFLSNSLKEFITLIIFQSTFYIDCVSTIFIRLYKKENILKPHKIHFYQELVHKLGWTHSKVTLLYSSIQLLIGIIAIGIFKYNIIFLILLWIAFILFYWTVRIRMNLLN